MEVSLQGVTDIAVMMLPEKMQVRSRKVSIFLNFLCPTQP